MRSNEIEAASINLRKAGDAAFHDCGSESAGHSGMACPEMQILYLMADAVAGHPRQYVGCNLPAPMARQGGQLEKADTPISLPRHPTQDITLLQRPSQFDYIFQGGQPIDRTPAKPRKRMWYERTKIFLSGLYLYNEETGAGDFIRE